MTKELPSESQLMADMDATFPQLFKRPLREFGKDYASMIGVWTGGPGDMPDGLPIFSSLRYHGDSEDPSDGSYDGGVHDGFTAWLESRGWYVENHDGETYLVIPIAYAAELSEENPIKEAV